VKLIEGGRLPKESIKKRTLDDILDRQIRVQQAVAACKEGKMSQSSAASHFEVNNLKYLKMLCNVYIIAVKIL
jgi:helix-turn-helix, Psq domain